LGIRLEVRQGKKLGTRLGIKLDSSYKIKILITKKAEIYSENFDRELNRVYYPESFPKLNSLLIKVKVR